MLRSSVARCKNGMHLRLPRANPKWLLVVVCSTVFFLAPQPSKPRDATPFARPKPFCTFNANDARAAFQKLAGIVAAQGFKSDEVNLSDGQLTASRPDSEGSANQDRVLVWLERDFEQPQSKLRLYFAYGRYEQFFGANGELVRVKVDSDFESQRVGPLKQKLIDFAGTGGPQ
jgi:hypothetical protein